MENNTESKRAPRWDASAAAKTIRGFYVEGNQNLRETAASIMRRYPLFGGMVLTHPENVLFALPAYESARKLETALRGDTPEEGDTEEDEAPEPVQSAAQPASRKAGKSTVSFPAPDEIDQKAIEDLLS